jgi:hypothetical protein
MILEAKDLRIGNFTIDEFGDIRKIISIEKNVVEFEYGIRAYYKEIKPIRLTEEWLLKFGFGYYAYGRWELHNFGNNKVGRHILRVSHDDEELITLANDDVGRELNYVHDLQNWVFGRIGVDLIIKK